MGDLPLIPILKRLAILSTLHHSHILRGEDLKWESLLTANFWFLGQISNRQPWEVAKLLTDTDHAQFRELCADDFLDIGGNESERLREILSRWDSLLWAVKICLAAHPDSVEPISEILEVTSITLLAFLH